MTTIRIALANLPVPPTPDRSVTSAEQAIAEASGMGADVICFPECFVPGYRAAGKQVPPPDPAFLDRAWSAIGAAARKAPLTVVLGTERVVDGAVLPSAVVIDRDGTLRLRLVHDFVDRDLKILRSMIRQRNVEIADGYDVVPSSVRVETGDFVGVTKIR